MSGPVHSQNSSGDTIEFNAEFQATEIEIINHRNSILQLADVTRACMERELSRHQRFFQRYRISPFYGSNSTFRKMNENGKRSELIRRGLSPSLLSEMEETSCVGFAIKCYREGFRATGQGELWERISSYAGKNSWDGSAILEAFRALDWQVSYWNPDTSKNKEWDDEEKRRDSSNNSRMWGYHSYRKLTVDRYNKYYKNNVDDKQTLVDFGTDVPYEFKKAPLFLGVAHTGFHVFPGSFGEIIEAHSTRQIGDYNTVETSFFNPLQNGGGPRGTYKSGLVALPPGYHLAATSRGGIRVSADNSIRRLATQEDWNRYRDVIGKGDLESRLRLVSELDRSAGNIADWALLILVVDKQFWEVKDRALAIVQTRRISADGLNLVWLHQYAGRESKLHLTKALEYVYGAESDRILRYFLRDDSYEVRTEAQRILRNR